MSEDEKTVPLGLSPDHEYGIESRIAGPDAVHTAWFERPSGEALEIWGYTDEISYAAGDTVILHVHTTEPAYDVVVYRDGAERKEVLRRENLAGQAQTTPSDAYAKGCDWAEALRFEVPADWASGGYVVELTCQKGKLTRQAHHWFAVRPQPGTGAGRLLLIAATGTWLAYNDWGGANHYEGETIPHGFSPILNTRRPWARGQVHVPKGAPRIPFTEEVPLGWVPRYPMVEWAYANRFTKYYACAGWASFESLFVRWAEEQGYAVDVMTQHDLHRSGEVLEGYSLAVIVGHDEYWSAGARDHLDAWVDGGGHLARLAGNFLWQTRISDDGLTQTCYKYAAPEDDPVVGTEDAHQISTCWDLPEIGRKGALTMGVTGTRGCYSGWGGWSPRSSGGYTVYRPESWVFEGSDLYFGDVFGAQAQIAGFEVDGLDYTVRYGRPYPTGADGVSEDQVTILAMSLAGFVEENHGNPGTNLFAGDGDAVLAAEILYGEANPETMRRVAAGCGTVVLYQRGEGEIFNAGAVEWVNGLQKADPFTERITRNVLDRYLGN